ncbi:MAG: superoxide dismutase, Ni [Candidatus Spechtbacteria bacterium RIFCSPLOWO2_02_FULL_38_8]|uniref:Superoxide dismutase, Ni n=1 Tax=Candidatus Spechtbacteria bacterium RIFCSPLOWO2_02_FULL_38_8 TaxID=1802164 RepID=A0A1G2HFN1_9BACT|nr:MAG: superoxide dismutase, Ni [Candidatus Spechtbacteria bacterium RIFCSPLOWO2_02_FULL_38_8]
MKFLDKVIYAGEVWAHCDLMCGVYDPAQARVEAQSVYNAVKLYQSSSDDIFKQRAITVKEERAEMVKYHLWVLWTDYFKPEHLKKFKNLHDLFWRATKAAGDIKKTAEIKDAQKLIDLVDEIGYIFEQTKEGYDYDAVKKNLEIQ